LWRVSHEAPSSVHFISAETVIKTGVHNRQIYNKRRKGSTFHYSRFAHKFAINCGAAHTLSTSDKKWVQRSPGARTCSSTQWKYHHQHVIVARCRCRKVACTFQWPRALTDIRTKANACSFMHDTGAEWGRLCIRSNCDLSARYEVGVVSFSHQHCVKQWRIESVCMLQKQTHGEMCWNNVRDSIINNFILIIDALTWWILKLSKRLPQFIAVKAANQCDARSSFSVSRFGRFNNNWWILSQREGNTMKLLQCYKFRSFIKIYALWARKCRSLASGGSKLY
jgi:hypothetical protein